MNKEEFKNIIIKANYFTKYEAIVDIKTKEIYAYEALSKFDFDNNIISTEDIFRYLHHNNNLFFQLEKRNKELQIKNFTKNKKLFLNFDADICVSDEQQNYWENFLLSQKENIVVEITENGSDDETSAKIMRNFSSWLSNKSIETALDDFGQDGSMFSFFMMNGSKYIKIDKSFIRQIDLNKNYLHYLKGVLKTIKLNGQKSIIEGVETKKDLQLAEELDCDYVQGYYFDQYQIIR
ncbi:hypothetical protein CPU12_12370 [Malaciobacter molluscorum LMG 25693]|uniref:Diguanylate phosphodiesterase n=1 Tax=Malaciobacter molluscorum LMG 25693 TaxID=870501 RepID=A0A2G1DF17_9BACT|nr:EAL domain-containing protein [Malaciobacter molluscorum]AXX93255.1 diguanylate phosphodiesterase [Malaciobacter molluscorum LMG 25693]PHO17040.1 hypothetical protein CPU12_12370 [Malaciobacter molluscorum LMG 25693]RXJ95693.1 hypothetical protein CRV00_04415 [Malaciobacter molluscorum]